MMWEALFLLLPIAAWSGWRLGRQTPLPQSKTFSPYQKMFESSLPSDLKLPSEGALEGFEAHLALGDLFRDQGEWGKAIHIHEKLIAKPSLTEAQRASLSLALSRDYMRAGVLDRAEALLLKLIAEEHEREAAFSLLMDIYQQSKDWEQAIETALRFQAELGRNMQTQIAHFYCERAEYVWLKGDESEAALYLKKALACHPYSVRANLLSGHMEAKAKRYHSAIAFYQTVQKQEMVFLSEVIIPLGRCYEGLNQPEKWVAYFHTVSADQLTVSAVLAFSEWLYKLKGEEAARDTLIQHLKTHPSLPGLKRLAELSRQSSLESEEPSVFVFQELIEKVLLDKPLYQCEACGFSKRTLQWQCPCCRRWDVIKPVYE